MRFRQFDDGKCKAMSYELELEFDFDETTAMAESKNEAILQMKQKVEELVMKLKAIDWAKL